MRALPATPFDACNEARGAFSAYLDGALDGQRMHRLDCHLRQCERCEAEFSAWRSVQTALSDLGPARIPEVLQSRLRDALAGERGLGRHRSPLQRVHDFLRETLAPVGLRLGAGLAATLLVLGSASWFIGSALPVQANDDRMAQVVPPQFLYAIQPTEPVETTSGPFMAVLVDAKVDAQGRVYDFDLIDGPPDAETHRRIAASLLESVFKPATVFGEPVPGHAMMTFSTVSVRG